MVTESGSDHHVCNVHSLNLFLILLNGVYIVIEVNCSTSILDLISVVKIVRICIDWG